MKNKKLLIITVIICLMPMVLGFTLYNKLPENMPTHFTINDVPDNYMPKNFALFGIPAIMAIVQTILVITTNRISIENKVNNKPKIIYIFQLIIPIITILVYVIMIRVSLGNNVYVGKSVCLILGILFILLGNYMPKMSYEVGKTIMHPAPKSERSFRKMTKIFSYSYIIVGIVLLISIIWV